MSLTILNIVGIRSLGGKLVYPMKYRVLAIIMIPFILWELWLCFKRLQDKRNDE